jgi:hypothetical protein
MTIASQTSRITYTGDGVTTAFSVPFYFQSNSDLVVYLQDTLGNLTLQVLGTNYNLSGATISTGGTCTFTAAPTTGYLITIYRDPPLTQTTSYNNNDPFPAKSHELALDKGLTIDQRTRDMVGRCIHIADGENIVTALGTVAARKNKILGFDTLGNLIYVLGPTFLSATTVGVAEVDSRATAAITTFANTINVVRVNGYYAAGDAGSGAVYVRGNVSSPGAFQDAGGVYWGLVLGGGVPTKAAWFGAKGDGVTDDAAAIRAAVTAAAGGEVSLHVGTFVIKSQVSYITAATDAPGLRLAGSGVGKTKIDNQCAGGVACIKAAGSVNFPAVGGYIKQISFISTTVAGAPAIELYSLYRYSVEDVAVSGMGTNGVHITCLLGDSDASNIILFKRCYFFNNNGYGLLHNFAAGIVQTSFVRCEDCFFHSNATGGWYWIGAAGSMSNCVFTENAYGVGGTAGLVIPNNGAANDLFVADLCSFENNWVSAVVISSLQQGNFRNCEIAGGTNPIVSTVGFNIGAGNNLRFEGTRVRVGSFLNPFTMFKFGAGVFDCSTVNTMWLIFDATGQTRFSVDATAYRIQLEDTMSPVSVGRSDGTSGITCVNGANQNVVVPNQGAAYAIGTGTTGAYNIGGFTNGFPGRRLYLLNNSGNTLTLNANDGGSSAVNRINTSGFANITVPNTAMVSLLYMNDSRWHFLGQG